MVKINLSIFLFCFILVVGCSNDDDNTANTNPPAGEVLLATVSGDSVGTSSGGSGTSTKSSTITGSTLDFTNRDSARITFYYSGENNAAPEPMVITYNDSLVLYSFTSLNPAPAEQFIDLTIASPKVNATFKYKITTSSSSGLSYFKFRELKLYKK